MRLGAASTDLHVVHGTAATALVAASAAAIVTAVVFAAHVTVGVGATASAAAIIATVVFAAHAMVGVGVAAAAAVVASPTPNVADYRLDSTYVRVAAKGLLGLYVTLLQSTECTAML
jgi:hypothetical protein